MPNTRSGNRVEELRREAIEQANRYADSDTVNVLLATLVCIRL